MQDRGRYGIYPDVKLLVALKILAFGVSGIAFANYFQMHPDTATDCAKEFAYTLINNKRLRSIYLRAPTPTDARLVSELHRQVHGVAGMLGSLDCMHIFWQMCFRILKA